MAERHASSDLARVGAHMVLALATLAVIGPQLGRGVMLWDQGEVVFLAQALASGGVPGIDFVVNAYGPGRYLVTAGGFLAFGKSLNVLWGLFLLLRLGISAAAYELALRTLPSRVAVLAWVLPAALLLLPGPLHKGFFVLGTLLLALSFVIWLDDPTPRRALAVGLLLAAVATFRVDLGVFGAAVFFIAAWPVPERSGQIFLVWGPLVLVMATFLAAVGAVGGGEAMAAVVDQVVDDIAKNNRIAYPFMPGLEELIEGASPGRLLLWAPLPVYLLLFVVLGVSPSSARAKLGVVLLLGVATCNQVRMKPEFGHLLQALPLAYLAWTLIAVRLFDAERSPGRRFAAALFASALPLVVLVPTLTEHRGSVYTGSFTIAEERVHALDTEMGTVLLNSGEHARLERILRFLRTAPPGPLWVPTNQPLIYGLSGREDVTGHVGLIYFADDPAREDRLIRRLVERPPAVVVYIDDTIEGPGRRLRAAAPRVHTFMQENYRTVRTHGDVEMMIRR